MFWILYICKNILLLRTTTNKESTEKTTTPNPEPDPENPDSKPVDDGRWFIKPPTGPPDSTQVFYRKKNEMNN